MKLVYGVGYRGEGKYSFSNSKKAHKHWCSMLERCYNEKHQAYKNYGGRGVLVCEEWHNFQNFAEWCISQFGFEEAGSQLDKDILYYFNKEYSPEKCCFLPKELNARFNFHSKVGNSGLPVGVVDGKNNGKRWRACSNGVKLGSFTTVKEAFVAYKSYKERLFKVWAEDFKHRISNTVYGRLYQLKVDPIIPTMDWKLDIISKQHFDKITLTGLAYVIYPDLPLTWEEARQKLKELGMENKID